MSENPSTLTSVEGTRKLSAGKSIYTLKGPCSNCPFRNDKPFYLGEDRVIEIAQSLRDGATFYCHKTLNMDAQDDSCDEEDEGNPTRDSAIGNRARACAGALATMENEERPNQIMRIAERLGLYDRHNLDPDAPVYSSLAEWTAARRKDETAAAGPEPEYCGVAFDQNCQNPAAIMGPFGVEESLEGPSTTTECRECGNPACEACLRPEDGGDGRLCRQCEE